MNRKWAPGLLAAAFLAAAFFLGGQRLWTATPPAHPASDRTRNQSGSDNASSKAAGAATASKPAGKQGASRYRSVRIAGVPHVEQKPDFCGEACAAMYLAKLGYAIDQDDVFDQSGLAPERGRGCYTAELHTALARIGFDVGRVWHHVAADRAKAELQNAFAALHADLAAGVPSIVCMHYDQRPDATEHFRLVLGYDAANDAVLYHEPAEARGAYRSMARETFLQLWPLKYADDRWTLIRFRLKPGAIRPVHSTAKFTDADYAQHIMRLNQKVPDGFTVVLQKPFVVIGDEPAASVRRWATGTVKWATDRLKRQYFAEDPDQILDIWLFQDKTSYRKHTKEIFHDDPDTPFGYFSSEHRALIMNIETGGGTLVHELVHPFMASNFPECPAWFNEGLASLYEQCGDRRGQIWGYTNWRLAGLQKVIQAEQAEKEEDRQQLPSFKTLCHTTTREFYLEDPGTNYAQARYLCFYLQQRGLLTKYYHQFRRNVRNDPSGYRALRDVLGVKDDEHMDRFQDVWEDWILKLRFP